MNTQEKESNATFGIASDQTNSASLKNEQLIEQKEIKDTPFIAVKINDTWMLTMGKYKLMEGLASFEDAEIAAFDTTWNRILQVVGIMIENWREHGDAEVTRLRYENEQLKKALSNVQ